MSHYLTTLRLTLGRETVFEGISSLQPGERLTLQDGRCSVERWAALPDPEPCEEAEAVDALDDALRDATRRRLAGDASAGLFLSGGVDSTTVGCLVADETGRGLPAGCGVGGPPEAGAGDSAFAADAARHARSELTTVAVGPGEYRDRWLDLATAYETPVSTPTDVILLRLAERTRGFAKFVLSGEGADELLCGYAVAHRSAADFERAARLAAEDWRPPSHVAAAFRTSLRRGYGRERFASPADHYFALNSLLPSAAKPRLFRPEFWDAAGRDAGMLDWYDASFAEHADRAAGEAMTRVLYRVNLEALLSRLDSAVGMAGLEARPVYTDDRVVDLGFRMPQRLKIAVADDEPAPYLAAGELHARGSLRDKRPLRAVAGRLMPRRLAHRPKAAFPTPVAGWLGGEWAGWACETLRASPFAAATFRPEAVEEPCRGPAASRDVALADPQRVPLGRSAVFGLTTGRHFGGTAPA